MIAPILKPLWTYDEVVAALGGPSSVARITGQARQAPVAWKKQTGKFPARHYSKIKFALAEVGHYAPIHLFTFDSESENFRGPKQAA